MRETLLLFIVLTEYCSSSCLFANVRLRHVPLRLLNNSASMSLCTCFLGVLDEYLKRFRE